MPKTDFNAYICRPYCIFFREGEKEEMACFGARVVERLADRHRIDPDRLPRFEKAKRIWMKHKACLEKQVCARCEFKAEDCDFQSAAPPDDAEPCGGFILLCLLLENGLIDHDALESIK